MSGCIDTPLFIFLSISYILARFGKLCRSGCIGFFNGSLYLFLINFTAPSILFIIIVDYRRRPIGV
ncbi:hypothetical protein F4811DRAFT_542314 [Daldinia bambusicola]|nr:hypothetical protein F4811DRAFT_542314 [Daldinia bambusicola]